MYVILDDPHLNDETMGKKNIPVGFFDEFLQNIKKKAEMVRAKSLKFFFNGDMLDLLYSAHWNYKIENGRYLYDPAGIRPWSENNHELIFKKTKEILEGLLNVPKVKEILSLFRSFLTDLSLPAEIDYIVGNHDRLISIYPELRLQVAEAFGMTNDKNFFFDEYFYDEKLGLYICHGNQYDVYNYEQDPREPLFGDAVVIELLNRLPIEIFSKTGSTYCFEKLAEIDEVRPQRTALNFSKRALRTAGIKPKEIVAIARQISEEFFSNEFVEDWLDTHILPSITLSPKAILHYYLFPFIIKALRFIGQNTDFDKTLIKLFNTFSLEERAQRNSTYKRHLNSRFFRRKWKNVKYAVLGHTHDYEESMVQNNQKTYTYINLGTWMARYCWVKGSDFEKGRRIAYAIFFEEGEKTKSDYLIEQKTIREKAF